MARIRKTKRYGNSDIIMLSPQDKIDLGINIGSDLVDIEDIVIIKNHTADKTLSREDNNAFVGTTKTNSNMSEVKTSQEVSSEPETNGVQRTPHTPNNLMEENDRK